MYNRFQSIQYLITDDRGDDAPLWNTGLGGVEGALVDKTAAKPFAQHTRVHGDVILDP